MCLIVDLNYHEVKNLNSNKPLKVVALKTLRPLKVYKVIELVKDDDGDFEGYQTPYQYLPVNFVNNKFHIKGVGFETESCLQYDDGVFFIRCGAHAFYKLAACQREVKNCIALEWDFRIHPAVIPANTSFYVGRDGDIVASRLEVFEDEESFQKYKKNAKNLSVAEEIIPTLARNL